MTHFLFGKGKSLITQYNSGSRAPECVQAYRDYHRDYQRKWNAGRRETIRKPHHATQNPPTTPTHADKHADRPRSSGILPADDDYGLEDIPPALTAAPCDHVLQVRQAFTLRAMLGDLDRCELEDLA